jgi:hypothetical protein
MEDNRTNPEDETLMVPRTIKHIEDSFLVVTYIVFPYCALETRKQWMSKYIIQYGSKAVHHLDEQDQQLHPVLSECNGTVDNTRKS